MNKKVLIGIVAVILIVAIGIVAGKKFGKPDSENTNTNSNGGTNTSISTPDIEEISTPDVEITPTPEETAEPIATPSPTQSSSNTGNTKLSSKQKEEKAKNIAKKEWEKLGEDVEVYYRCDKNPSDGKYLVSVRDASTTAALIWYNVDIDKGTCDITY